MSLAFGWTLIGLLALLGAVECRRYTRAARGSRTSEELPYPRARLVRRLIVGFLFGVSVALVSYWPDSHWALQMACLGAVCAAMTIGLVLLWRDLHETSVEVVLHSQRMHREAGQSLQGWFDEQKKVRGKK